MLNQRMSNCDSPVESGAAAVADEGVAVLSSKGRYTSFSFGGTVVRFRTSSALERYVRVLKWDDGYIEVLARYNGREEEEYIDLIPILDNLYINSEEFLKPIKKVEVSYA